MKRALSKRNARRLVAAFTLVELMVSVGIGGVAITAIYALGSASTRQFQQQQQIAATQSALRFAMHQVKSDIARAGFMASARASNGTPFSTRLCGGTISNALSTPYVGGATGMLAGISAFGNNEPGESSPERTDTLASSGGLQVNVANGFTADHLLLIGNYETSHEYPIAVRNNSQIAITPTSHAALIDFAWTDAGLPQAGFSQAMARLVFAQGSLIRIQTINRMHHFALVDSADLDIGSGELRVIFNPPLPGNCVNEADGGWIAPLSVIRYAAAEGAGSWTDAARSTSMHGRIAQLRRTEVRADLKDTGFRGNVRHVLDYLAAFNLEFTMNEATDPGARDEYVIGQRASEPVNNDADVNLNPQRVRSVFIELAARLPSMDNTFPFAADVCGLPLRCYQVATEGSTSLPLSTNFAARVRVLRSEVFIPNIAYEGY
jgi:type II secretory pathway pseudopilin PulG